MEQSDSQLMMAAQLGLSRLDARRSEHALLTWSVVSGTGSAREKSHLTFP
jgi:hypothetical protein